MGQIELTRGLIALVDDEMVTFLNQFSWYAAPIKIKSLGCTNYYAVTDIIVGGKSHKIYMHRLLTGFRNGEVDHINYNGLDNRRVNLRRCSRAQNRRNTRSRNKTGFRGVKKNVNCSTFECCVSINGKKTRFSGFKTAEAAARAYDKAAWPVYGEFGIYNFPHELGLREGK